MTAVDWTDAPMVGDVIRHPAGPEREIVAVSVGFVQTWCSETRRSSWIRRTNLHRYRLVRPSKGAASTEPRP